jgi:HPt (histidine-containing phosphotransfer) domain-containing protein
MIDTFLEENPKEIESLEKAIQSKDFEAIKQTAHLLQSSIPFVGLDKIIESEVYEIEEIAADKSVVKKIEILPNDKSEFQKIEISLTDKSAFQKIELLFSKVKDACEKARLELKN